jgi:dipeptidyl aminopeptidase/acylaminoacyl peptidase
MRLNGAERTPLVPYATEVSWWNDETLLVWTPTQDAYLLHENESDIIPLETSGIVNVQPGGRWALRLEQRGDHFARVLVAIDVSGAEADALERVELGLDRPYFNVASWSPDGRWLAFTAPLMTGDTGEAVSSEIFGIQPDTGMAAAWTDLTARYGSLRINGHAPGLLSWSPDGSRIAFWVVPLTGPDPETDTAQAAIHVLDVTSGALTRYCGFQTDEHTPNPPRLIWSPDGHYLAFGANLPNDERGYVLLTLDTRTGAFIELSAGLYPALGHADVIGWGLLP